MARSRRRKSNLSARDKRARRTRAARRARREVQLEREVDRRLDELFGAETPPERAAAAWLERLDGDPVPARVSRMFALAGSDAQAHAVAAQMEAQAPGSAPALTLAADVAFQLDGDVPRASTLLDRALEAFAGAEARVTLADHLVELGRVAESQAVVAEQLLERPEDEDAQHVHAAGLELARRRLAGEEEPVPGECPCRSGRSWSDCCRPEEERALECFGDRDRLDGLREAVSRFTASAPGLRGPIAEHVEQWLEGAEPFAPEASAREALVGAATEHAWLVVGEHEDDDEDAPLALFASSRSTAAADAAAAERWTEHCEYGLWQLADPTPAPGVWLTELLTGTRRYAAIPPQQLEGAGRWTVLLGALVALDGTWRPASPLIALRPREADEIAELAEELIGHVACAASGKGPIDTRPGRWVEEPPGVLAAQGEPASPEVASFAAKVIGVGMPQLLAMLGELRERAPQLRNTDHDPLCLINATIRLGDPGAVAERLAAHPDIECDGEALDWWGRELDELERASGEAEVRAMLRERGEDPDEIVTEGPRRWLRGRIKPLGEGLEIDVNSRERLDRFLGLLRELGEEPDVSKQLVIDPAQDMPQLRAGQLLAIGGSEASQAAWLAHFPDQRLPALGDRTPREAALRPRDAPRLEALLREFEHDADILRERGRPAPDIDLLREELRAPASAWL